MADETGNSWSLPVTLVDQAETEALAARLAALCRAGDVLALDGPLGIGKTVFARALINAIAGACGAPEEDVPSPTYTLVQIYSFPALEVYHADLYRVEDMDEIWELGLDEAFDDALTLIEWPDRMGDFLPRQALRIAFDQGSDAAGRVVRFSGGGDWRSRLEAGICGD